MPLDTQPMREHLQQLAFDALFIGDLGWNNPPAAQAGRTTTLTTDGVGLEQRYVAQLGGVVVIELRAVDGRMPDAKERAAVHHTIGERHHEHLLIFTDAERTRSLWSWTKRDGGRAVPREHLYVKGQPGDLFLSKLAPMFVDISDLDETGNVPVTQAVDRLREALDVQPVTKKFYEEFRDEHLRFTDLIGGIDSESDRRWYASVLLNRLMFVYFLQRKGFLDHTRYDYLRDKLLLSKERGGDRFYQEFLKALFFEGFAKPARDRAPAATALVGDIPYLNGGLFLEHQVEKRWRRIEIPDRAFDNLFALFGRYSWNLNDTPGGNDNEINPDVLGYIFEKYINQQAFGAYYTPPEITEYLCEQTIHRLILAKINLPAIPGLAPARTFATMAELLMALDARLCRELLFEVLPRLSLLDPACGSGAFLVAAMKTLITIYSAVTGRIPYLNDPSLDKWWREAQAHRSLHYYIKKKIITENLYGVDIMAEATDIARLRLFLALVSSVSRVEDLEPLPNIDFNILPGNSLIGLLRVDAAAYNRQGGQLGLFNRPYRELVDEKNRLVGAYRDAAGYSADLQAMRDTIEEHRETARANLNQLLLDQWRALKIKFEGATWDDARGRPGKPEKRDVQIGDIEALTPFHWGYEFDQVMNERGGFDAIITNPPWEVWQTDEKEFFQQFVPTIQKNKLRIEDWKKQQATYMRDPELHDAWLTYASRYPHTSQFFKLSPDYANQASFNNGKRIPSKINLYALFLERCYSLLRAGGECGIVVPSGIYTDLGAMQLRRMLFEQTRMTGLFGWENRKAIFEGVHRSFKFIALTFEKGGATASFPAAFMRHDVAELADFPTRGGLELSVELIRRLSPDSLSVMEFKNELDVQIAEKMLRFPLLGERLDGVWNLVLTQEFNMTTDSHLFETAPGPGRLPLFVGKMFHQFEQTAYMPTYWIPEAAGRRKLIGRVGDSGQPMDYQVHRWVHRRIARNTDSRTMISTMTPKMVFTEVNSTTIDVTASGISQSEMLALCAMANSFAVDWILRLKVTTTLNMFFIDQLPVPRLTPPMHNLRPSLSARRGSSAPRRSSMSWRARPACAATRTASPSRPSAPNCGPSWTA